MTGKYTLYLDMTPDVDYAPDKIREALEKAGYKAEKVEYLGEIAEYYERGKDESIDSL